MITAEEARRESEKHQSDKDKSIIKSIEEKIRESFCKEAYEIHYTGPFSNGVERFLENYGYSLYFVCQYKNGDKSIKISW